MEKYWYFYKIGNQFCIEILDFMRDKMIKYQEEQEIYIILKQHQLEGTTYRFAKEDKKKIQRYYSSWLW